MQKHLQVTLVQMDTIWHDASANRKQIDEILNHDPAVASSDLIALPEMFTTGFTMDAESQAETMQGESIAWMRQLAKRHGAVVTGTLVIRDKARYFNRLIWMRPDGEHSVYDKRHLFRMADEHLSYSAGSDRPVFELAGWRVRPIICYDVRFPVWCRNRQNEYDLLLCLANWPSPRHQAWLCLNQARAIENQACVIAVNRVGQDRTGKDYLGGSMVFDAKGVVVADAKDQACLVHARLDRDELESFRSKFPVHQDADKFSLEA